MREKTVYSPMYKCRNCGEIILGKRTFVKMDEAMSAMGADSFEAESMLLHACFGEKYASVDIEPGKAEIALAMTHICENNDIGFAELAGMKQVGKELKR